MDNWVKLLNRECSLAFQVEVPLANRSTLPKAIGTLLIIFGVRALHLVSIIKGLNLKD